MTASGLPTPLEAMLALAEDRSLGDFLRLKSYCDLAEHTTRLLAAAAVADCRRQDVTNDRLGQALGRLSTTGLQFGHWVGLLDGARLVLRQSRNACLPELAQRARAWGGRQSGYLDWLSKLLGIRNAVHHSSLQTAPAEIGRHLRDCEIFMRELLEAVDFLGRTDLVAVGVAASVPGVTWWRGAELSASRPPARFDTVPVPDGPGVYLLTARVALRLDPLLTAAVCPECGRFGTFALDRLGGLMPATFIGQMCPHRVDLPHYAQPARELVSWSGSAAGRAAVTAPRVPSAGQGQPEPRIRPARPPAPKPAEIEAAVAEAIGPAAAEYFRGLTTDQLQAVTYTAGPSAVLAGAGTGKTRVLACRIAWLCTEGAAPDSILAVTFTNRAMREMRERLDAIWGRTAPVEVSTVHAAGYRILRERAGSSPLVPAGFAVADDETARQLMLQAHRDGCLELGQRWDRQEFAALALTVGRAKEALMTPDGVRARGPAYNLTAAVYERYERLLAGRNLLDFSDLIGRCCALLDAEPSLAAQLRARWQWVLVDEYQDLNDAQVRWLGLVRGGSPRFFAAGDDDQMIYGWRGARATRVQELLDEPGMRKLALRANFRSTKAILRLADGLIRRNSRRLDKQISFDFAVDGAPIVAHAAADEAAEAEWIVGQIVSQAERRTAAAATAAGQVAGAAYGSQCVLVRSGRLLDPIAELLREYGIPHRRVAERGFLGDPLVKLMLSVMQHAAAGAAEQAVAELAAGLGRGAGGPVRPAGDQETGFREWLAAAPGPAGTNRDVASGAVEMLTGILGPEERHDEAGAQSAQAADELLLAALEYDQAGGGGLAGFVASLRLQSDGYGDDPQADEVRLMTMHAVKGLEFPVVYLAGLCDLQMPLIRDEGYAPLDERSRADKEEEERRLLYVGMMRARERLFMSFPETRIAVSSGKVYSPKPSRFLAELGRGVAWV